MPSTMTTGKQAPAGTSPQTASLDWIDRLRQSLTLGEAAGVTALITADGWLQDRLTLTWDLRTFHGSDDIRRALEDRLTGARFEAVELDSAIEPSVVDGGSLGQWVQASFVFETVTGRGRGVVRLVEDADSDETLAWTVSFELRELRGHEERRGFRRPEGVTHGPKRDAINWLDRRNRRREFTDGDPAVVIVGAGQGGLSLAARLGQLDVPTLVLERRPRVGDGWRSRYHSLVLHDAIWSNHLPYVPFPDTWPRYIAKDKLADWFESYVQTMELDVWTGATAEQCAFDPDSRRWTMTISREGSDRRVLRPRHVVFATGQSGFPQLPDVPGASEFAGEIIHASAYSGAAGAAGKRAIVVGAGNSSHDVCHDLADAGADVTMVQRSKTYVHGSRNAFDVTQRGLFDEGGPTTEDADHLANSLPLPVLFDLQREHVLPQIRHLDEPMRSGLRQAGFRLDDEHSLIELYLRRGGGYYIDVGAAHAIADGRIKVRSAVGLSGFTERGVVFTDGSQQPADFVIFATGYGDMRDAARELLGDSVIDQCDPPWGIDDEGETRAWRASGHDRLWFFGGNLAFARHHSLTVALQIKADEIGLLDRYEAGS